MSKETQILKMEQPLRFALSDMRSITDRKEVTNDHLITLRNLIVQNGPKLSVAFKADGRTQPVETGKIWDDVTQIIKRDSKPEFVRDKLTWLQSVMKRSVDTLHLK